MSESQPISFLLNLVRVEKFHAGLHFSFLLHLVNYIAGQLYSLVAGQLLKESADLQFMKGDWKLKLAPKNQLGSLFMEPQPVLHSHSMKPFLSHVGKGKRNSMWLMSRVLLKTGMTLLLLLLSHVSRV